MGETGEKPIDLQALEFAEKITEITRIFGGPRTPGYISDIISDGSGWLIEIHNNKEGFTLKADGNETFLVQAAWTCTTDGSGKWLKVQRSSFGLYFCSRPRRPLLGWAEFSARWTKT